MNGKAEETMGRCLKRLNVPRSKLVITTKLFWGGDAVTEKGLSRKHIVEGLKGSLKRLDLEYVDVVYCHRPDPATPVEETVRAMNWVIEKGWAFYWGTSEWPVELITEAHETAKRLGLIAPICDQPQYSMLHRTRFELEYAPLYRLYGYGTTVWSPLACGLLTGKYTDRASITAPDTGRLGGTGDKYASLTEDLLNGKGMNGMEEKDLDSILRRVAALGPIAESLGCSRAQLALAWVLANPNVSTAITGASSPKQLVESFGALRVLPQLTPPVLEEIEKILANRPTPRKDFRF